MALTKWPKENEQIYTLMNREVQRCIYKGRTYSDALLIQLLPSQKIVSCLSHLLYSSLQEAEEAYWGFDTTRQKKTEPTFRSNPETAPVSLYSGCERCRRVLRNGEKCDCTIGIRA